MLIIMFPILTNKDVLEPSYKNKKFMVQNHNFFANLNISKRALVVKNLSVNAGDARDGAWEDPLEKETATHSVFLPGKSHRQRSLEGYRVAKSQTKLSTDSGTHGPVSAIYGKYLSLSKIKQDL